MTNHSPNSGCFFWFILFMASVFVVGVIASVFGVYGDVQ